LSLNRRTRVSLPMIFGEKQKGLVEEAFMEVWQFKTVEMVKRNGAWFAHFVLAKIVNFEDAETVIALDRGEVNLAVAVAVSKDNPRKPLKGRFWRGQEIKRARGLYNHIRRKFGEKKIPEKIKEIGGKEKRKVKQQLHILANQVVEYAKQFPKPLIAMEDLNGLRKHVKFSKRLNRRIHSTPYRKLQTIIEYKANLEGIEVRYIEAKGTSKTCHRCGYVALKPNGRELKCLSCGLIYNRDLNGAVNIAYALTRGMGWGSRDTPKLSNEAESEKP